MHKITISLLNMDKCDYLCYNYLAWFLAFAELLMPNSKHHARK